MGRPSGTSARQSAGAAVCARVLSNVSDATGKNERIELFTALLQDGTLYYLIGVAPDDEFSAYQPVFRKVASSVQFIR